MLKGQTFDTCVVENFATNVQPDLGTCFRDRSEWRDFKSTSWEAAGLSGFPMAKRSRFVRARPDVFWVSCCSARTQG
jgi:hypothetical protein